MSESMIDAPSSAQQPRLQAAIGVGALLVGGVLAAGATQIPSDAGYAGVGPNFLPWVVAVALLACGGFLLWEVARGGYRELELPSGAAHGDWPALAWVSAGVLLNAALITTIGFILANALCFTLAVRGLRASEGKPAGSLRQTLVDAATGLVIAAPVFWLFTRLLAINLPGLTGTGWL
ncbi:MAG: tripartite tricarboxylate transporter TctB family protein [Burkholderiaceae bacterium]|nr:tripartite tricarboxylate transporter TctB family protein [Burkholderiaceae bacterium]